MKPCHFRTEKVWLSSWKHASTKSRLLYFNSSTNRRNCPGALPSWATVQFLCNRSSDAFQWQFDQHWPVWDWSRSRMFSRMSYTYSPDGSRGRRELTKQCPCRCLVRYQTSRGRKTQFENEVSLRLNLLGHLCQQSHPSPFCSAPSLPPRHGSTSCCVDTQPPPPGNEDSRALGNGRAASQRASAWSCVAQTNYFVSTGNRTASYCALAPAGASRISILQPHFQDKMMTLVLLQSVRLSGSCTLLPCHKLQGAQAPIKTSKIGMNLLHVTGLQCMFTEQQENTGSVTRLVLHY